MNHKGTTYKTKLLYVVIAMISRAQTSASGSSSVLGWGALALMAEHAGSRDVDEARRPHTCSTLCAFEEKKTKQKKTRKVRPAQNTHYILNSTAIATTSRRHAKVHAPHVSLCTSASIDTGFVEIVHAQLLQSITTTNVTHTPTDTQTDRRTDRQTN